MLEKINGTLFIAMINSGIQNLEKNRAYLNDLNVFPVPDGDTGTNMLMTARYGFDSVKGKDLSLQDAAGQFASAAVFGARGNSGVILSQFFKGVSVGFSGFDEASPEKLVSALESGCKYAYSAVDKPVEGTMLTVIKDGSMAVKDALPFDSINGVVDVFLDEARRSLQRTPELLPILKKAGVVDSGGSGVVCFFEGVKKYLNGEKIELEKEVESTVEQIDLTKFSKSTVFDFGYCVEGVLQIINDRFDFKSFKNGLNKLGEYLVISLEGDKVKLHIHAKMLGALLEYCQHVGEFLTIKIDNMTVQNLQKEETKRESERFLYSKDRETTGFAVIAVATNQKMQKMFFDMGADVVILSEIAPSSQDFLDAFEIANSKEIIVFPNSSNSILSSMQAGSICKNAKVVVLNSRSCAECYSALAVMDFDSDMDCAIACANETISGIKQFSVYHASKTVKFGSKLIDKDDFFALSSNNVLGTSKSLEEIIMKCVKNTVEEDEYFVITLFCGRGIDNEYAEYLKNEILKLQLDVEIACIHTNESNYSLTVFFE